MIRPNHYDIANAILGFLLGMFIMAIPYTSLRYALSYFHLWNDLIALFVLGFCILSGFFTGYSGEGRMWFWKSEDWLSTKPKAGDS